MEQHRTDLWPPAAGGAEGHGLDVHLARDRGTPVLHVRGELDLLTATDLRWRGRAFVDAALVAADREGAAGLRAARDHPAPPAGVVVLDATEIVYVDSAGLGAVIDVLKCVRAHRAGFSIAGASPQLHDLLQRTGLDRVIALHTTSGEAVDAASGTARRRAAPSRHR